MKIQSIVLNPFAGFSHLELEFKPGLNVILGPNDIGKSTLFRAIESAFFLPTRLKANTLEGRELKRIIPLGGDHARVKVEFETPKSRYTLEKTWGAQSQNTLHIHSQSQTLTTSDRIETELQDIMPVPSATFRTVFLSKQNTLERTLEDLSQNPESLHSLGDVLRLAIRQSAQFSIDGYQSLLEKKIEEALLNWDPLAETPKKNRGIENPWDRQGKVLKAYYQKEGLRKSWQEAQALETELGEKNRILREKVSKEKDLKEFIKTNQSRVEALGLRQALQAKLDQANREASQLTTDLNRWIQMESDRKVLEPEIARLESLLAALEIELKNARLEVSRKNLFARFERLEIARKDWEDKKTFHQSLPMIHPEDLQQLRNLWGSIEKSRASLLAAKLQVNFVAKVPMEVRFKKDLEPEKKSDLTSGNHFVIQAGGRIQLSHESFEITVSSGDGKMEKIEASLKKDSESLRQLFASLQIKSMEEAQEKSEKWINSTQALRVAESGWNALLAGDSYEEIKKQVQDHSISPHQRPPEIVEKDYLQLNSQLATKKGQLSASQRIIQDLCLRYEVQDTAQLTSLMIRKGVEQESLKQQLNLLPPPPEGVDPSSFLAQYKKSQSELPLLAEEIRTFSNQAVELKIRLPECSAQDLQRQYREAVQLYERETASARALLKVRETIQKIETLSGNQFQEFQSRLESDCEKMSLGKYKRAKLSGALPTEFIRNNQQTVPFSWLSSGTKDGFALSLRLTIASYFLRNSPAFILMDDPMVSLDLERQKIASELLKQFSDRAQIILFTCHSDHAVLLGGNRIELEK